MTTPETVNKGSVTFSKECLGTDPDKDVDESDCRYLFFKQDCYKRLKINKWSSYISAAGVHICEVCGTSFGTRKGLSSHARYHLRQLGVGASDSSGAPIDLLYQLMKERGGTLPKLQKQTSTVNKPSKLKKDAGPKLKIKISNLVKKKYALSSSSTSAVKKSAKSGRLPFTAMKPHKISSKGLAVSAVSKVRSGHKVVESSDSSPSTSIPLTTAKPLWAPQETDAPINLSE